MAELPQFSRNYGSRGGAYESPVTAIDYSGKEYAKAITNIGNSVAKVINEKTKRNSSAVQETQKYLDYNAKFILENYDEFSANMEEVGVNNPSLNKAGLFAIEKKAQAYMAMKSSTSKELQMEAAREYALWDGKINELTQLINAGKEANESYYADYVDGYPKVNTEGGISTTNANVGLSKQYQLAMPARIGATRNPQEQWFFDENDNWKIKTAYSSEQITQAYKNGEIKNNYVVADPKVLFSFDGGKIPNITADRNKFLEESGIFKNGKFGDDYVSEPELKTTENKQFEYTFRPSKFADIETTATPFITAQVNSFLKFPEKAKNIWSHVLNGYAPEGAELNYANGQVGTAFDEKSSKMFSEAYTAWFLDDLRKKGGNASNYNKIKPEKDKDKEVIDVSYIKDLKIPVQEGPPLESGQRPVDLVALEEQLNKEGFRVTKSEEVGPRGVSKITITKSIAGADNQAVISEEMTPQDIKRNLELVETGKMPAKTEDEDFSLYKINQ
jgi:hypothetical protein